MRSLPCCCFGFLWGFAGSRYARFASFLPSPVRHLAHAALGKADTSASAGHSDIGTLSVFTLLIVLLVQVDRGNVHQRWKLHRGSVGEVRLERDQRSVFHLSLLQPLADRRRSSLCTSLRLCFTLLVRRNDLITPMLTGDKLGLNAIPAEDGAAIRLRAAVLAAIAGAIVYFSVT